MNNDSVLVDGKLGPRSQFLRNGFFNGIAKRIAFAPRNSRQSIADLGYKILRSCNEHPLEKPSLSQPNEHLSTARGVSDRAKRTHEPCIVPGEVILDEPFRLGE